MQRERKSECHDIGRDVDPVRPLQADPGDDQAPDGRTQDLRGIPHELVVRGCGREQTGRHQVRRHGRARRHDDREERGIRGGRAIDQHQRGLAGERTPQQHHRRQHQRELGCDQDPSPVARVDHGPDRERREDHGEHAHQADGTDRSRRPRDAVDLYEQRHRRDLVPGLGDQLPEPQQTEVARLPQRSDVDCQTSGERDEGGHGRRNGTDASGVTACGAVAFCEDRGRA